MATKHHKTFQEILREQAPKNALRLETKARSASWLAKIQPEQSHAFYSIKHAALRQLFHIPEEKPVIREAWVTGRGFLLSLGLKHTGALLHLPFNQLSIQAQESEGFWVAKCARGRKWQRTQDSRPLAEGRNDVAQIRRAS